MVPSRTSKPTTSVEQVSKRQPFGSLAAFACQRSKQAKDPSTGRFGSWGCELGSFKTSSTRLVSVRSEVTIAGSGVTEACSYIVSGVVDSRPSYQRTPRNYRLRLGPVGNSCLASLSDGVMQLSSSSLARCAMGPLISVAAACALLAALHRSLLRAGATADPLMLGAFRDFRLGEWALVLGVATACAVAVVRRRRRWLNQVQAWSLAAGLWLTQLNLGSEVGEKLDPRLVCGLIAGIASLHCCYVCLVAHVAIAVSSGTRGRASLP